MVKRIYIEKSIKDHPRVAKVLSFYPNREIVFCDHYGEVFNPRSQNFRLQKANQALILAKKTGKKVLAAPSGFGIGSIDNYYFSHVLNCLYDCRYCFLQGLYPSAHMVLFVNYEDFILEIEEIISENKNASSCFFSGYDSDSLAFENVSGFFDEFYEVFKRNKKSILELRTKSINIGPLLKKTPIPNVVVAFSLTPKDISLQVEKGTPAFSKRLKAIELIAEKGWNIGLRLDPLIECVGFESLYRDLLEKVLTPNILSNLHSISVGTMRFPEKVYKRIKNLYPNETIFTEKMEVNNKVISYPHEREDEMKKTIRSLLGQYNLGEKVFECRYE